MSAYMLCCWHCVLNDVFHALPKMSGHAAIRVKRAPPPPGHEDVPLSMGPLLDHHPSGGLTDGDPSPPFACGRTERCHIGQTLCVLSCCVLHTWTASENRQIVRIQKGYPHQNSSCLTDCAQLFPWAYVWSRQDPPADIQAHSVRGLSSSTALLRDMSLEDVSMASLCPSIRFYQRDKFQFWVIHCWMCLVMFDVIFYCLGWQLQPLVSHTLRLEAVMHYEYCAHALS